MKRVLHIIEHLFGWNTGRIIQFTDNDGHRYTGFKCKCKKITNVTLSGINRGLTKG